MAADYVAFFVDFDVLCMRDNVIDAVEWDFISFVAQKGSVWAASANTFVHFAYYCASVKALNKFDVFINLLIQF